MIFERLFTILGPVFWGLVVLSLLVFLHEGGHYFAARLCKVRATEFFLGMPCKHKLSFRSKRFGTEIGITPILLGGYTAISGMEGDNSLPQELYEQILGSVTRAGEISVSDLSERLGADSEEIESILFTLSDWASLELIKHTEKDDNGKVVEIIEGARSVERDSKLRTIFDVGHDFSLPGATKAGEPRDLAISDQEFYNDERSHTYQGASLIQKLFMLAAGATVNIVFAVLLVVVVFSGLGIDVAQDISQIGSVQPQSLAATVGLQPDDKILSVGDKAVSSWTEMGDELSAMLKSGKDFTMLIERDGKEQLITIPNAQVHAEYLGIMAPMKHVRLTVGQSVGISFAYGQQLVQFAVKLLIPTHTGEVLQNSSSVVGISVMASEAAKSGLPDFLTFMAMISASLGVMNLLPVPPLDGGKILIEFLQKLMRRTFSPRVVERISLAGLMFFLFIFIMSMKNDIVRFIIGG